MEVKNINSDEYLLWEQLKKGNQEAFLNIYQSNYQSLFAYGFKISKDKELTKDVIQDIFLDLWNKKSALPEVHKTKAYLLTYLRRALLKKINIKEINADQFYDKHFELILSYENIIIEKERKKELYQKLSNALNTLTPRQREIIHLKFYEQLSYEEISNVMEMKYQSVLNLTHESIKILREVLISIFCFIKIVFF